jgi:hypothetical protein
MEENAMWSRCARFFEIALVLLLILMAGGDDFYLCRITAPSFFSTCPADFLPLDDPNTDFTKSEGSQSPVQTGKIGFRDMTTLPARLGIALPLGLWPSRLNDPNSSSSPTAHAELLTPLRC